MGQVDSEAGLLRSPLDAEHRAAGAKMGAFAGWLMPIEYAGTLAEHKCVREAVGLFDVSHLGKVLVRGGDASQTLQRALSNDLRDLTPGKAAYGMVLNDSGGIIDDLITYRVDSDRYLVVPNAANRDAVAGVLRGSAAKGAEVRVLEDLCTFAVQGPASIGLTAEIFPEAASLEYMTTAEVRYGGRPMIVARSGYTGERGFELFVPEEIAQHMWAELMERGRRFGLQPCGLAARDTLRLEMGYPLHGNDIGPDRSPLEAGLAWAVDLEKGEFPGRAALLSQLNEGVPSRLWGLRMTGRLIPRLHYGVFDREDLVGETTSGTFSPTLRAGIALGYLAPRERFSTGDLVQIDVRGRRGEARVERPPFVDRSPK